MPKVTATLALFTICSVGVAAPSFEFDRQLAVELARDYIHSQLRVSTGVLDRTASLLVTQRNLRPPDHYGLKW
jgi:hypothetical protein